jgi:hypothetical protein
MAEKLNPSLSLKRAFQFNFPFQFEEKFNLKPMAKHPERGLATLKKHRHTFIPFDIIDFYTHRSQKSYWTKYYSWASNLARMSKDDISIIKHARKSLLFNDGKPWLKKDSNSLSDATIGSYDGER